MIDIDLLREVCFDIKPDVDPQSVELASHLIDDLNFDSISLVSIIVELESRTSLDLAEHAEQFIEANTVGDIIAIVNDIAAQ
ncbi:acyl carrier protein [Teredinibacter purpureus]|uniref:acyl carrier protein n=1 Tax=Teredinibacter purpureus TaxID=2731756 RepID=UPI0005F7E3F8|nr:phosphopantetheine-binding protein [Teredinibacter purpureus]